MFDGFPMLETYSEKLNKNSIWYIQYESSKFLGKNNPNLIGAISQQEMIPYRFSVYHAF